MTRTTNSLDTPTALEGMAVAYVWGWQDAQGPHATDTKHALDFGTAYREHAERYVKELISYRRNIADAYLRFRHGDAIEADFWGPDGTVAQAHLQAIAEDVRRSTP